MEISQNVNILTSEILENFCKHLLAAYMQQND